MANFRVYLAEIKEIPGRIKIGMAEVTEEDENDPECFNLRCRALCQGGGTLNFIRSYYYARPNKYEKDLISVLEKQLQRFMPENGYQSLQTETQMIGHGEWFLIDRETAMILIDNHIKGKNDTASLFEGIDDFSEGEIIIGKNVHSNKSANCWGREKKSKQNDGINLFDFE